jgi:hypothetical protein
MANTVGPIEDVLRQALAAYLASNAAIAGTQTIDTELPAAVAAADDMANPTAPQVLGHNLIWDSAGTNWDRQSGAGGKTWVAPLNANSLVDGSVVNAASTWDSGGASRLPAVGPDPVQWDQL